MNMTKEEFIARYDAEYKAFLEKDLQKLLNIRDLEAQIAKRSEGLFDELADFYRYNKSNFEGRAKEIAKLTREFDEMVLFTIEINKQYRKRLKDKENSVRRIIEKEFVDEMETYFGKIVFKALIKKTRFQRNHVVKFSINNLHYIATNHGVFKKLLEIFFYKGYSYPEDDFVRYIDMGVAKIVDNFPDGLGKEYDILAEEDLKVRIKSSKFEDIEKILEFLTSDKKVKIYKYYFGIDCAPMSFEMIAYKMGIPRQSVVKLFEDGAKCNIRKNLRNS